MIDSFWIAPIIFDFWDSTFVYYPFMFCHSWSVSPIEYSRSCDMSSLRIGDKEHHNFLLAISWIACSRGWGSSSMKKSTREGTQKRMNNKGLQKTLYEWTTYYSLQKTEALANMLTETSWDPEPEASSHTSPKFLISETLRGDKCLFF